MGHSRRPAGRFCPTACPSRGGEPHYTTFSVSVKHEDLPLCKSFDCKPVFFEFVDITAVIHLQSRNRLTPNVW